VNELHEPVNYLHNGLDKG